MQCPTEEWLQEKSRIQQLQVWFNITMFSYQCWIFHCENTRILCLNMETLVLISGTAFTHWGRVMHICFGKFTITGSDNGLSPGRRQAIIWTNAGLLLIGHLGTNFSEILIEIYTFSSKKMHLKRSSGKWRPFRLGLNVFTMNHAS